MRVTGTRRNSNLRQLYPSQLADSAAMAEENAELPPFPCAGQKGRYKRLHLEELYGNDLAREPAGVPP